MTFGWKVVIDWCLMNYFNYFNYFNEFGCYSRFTNVDYGYCYHCHDGDCGLNSGLVCLG